MSRFTRSFRARPVIGLVVLVATAGVVLAAGMAGTRAPGDDPANSDVVLLVLYVLLALGFSFLCSVAEAVLLSITPSYIAGLRADHPKRAESLTQLKQTKVDRSLAAILTLNTIAHTVGAIGAGAKATVVFGSAYFGVFSAVMTLMILFFSEIIPKTLGALWWRQLSGPTVHFVRGLIFLLYPLIAISELLTRLISRGHQVHVFSRDEFVAMAAIGEESGHLKSEESRIIRNLMSLRAVTAEDVMTPRMVIKALPRDRTVSEVLPDCAESPFSRLPLYGKDLDEITGFVLKDELLLAEARDQGSMPLIDLRREIQVVPRTMPLSDLLEFLLSRHAHLAVVLGVDYGGTAGLVTLEDVVETLLGVEIVDEADHTEDMRELARQRWRERAKALGLDPAAADCEATPPEPESDGGPR